MAFCECPLCGFYICHCSRSDLETYEGRHRYEMGYDQRLCVEDRINDLRAEERREEERREEEAREEYERREAARERREEEEAYWEAQQEQEFEAPYPEPEVEP